MRAEASKNPNRAVGMFDTPIARTFCDESQTSQTRTFEMNLRARRDLLGCTYLANVKRVLQLTPRRQNQRHRAAVRFGKQNVTPFVEGPNDSL